MKYIFLIALGIFIIVKPFITKLSKESVIVFYKRWLMVGFKRFYKLHKFLLPIVVVSFFFESILYDRFSFNKSELIFISFFHFTALGYSILLTASYILSKNGNWDFKMKLFGGIYASLILIFYVLLFVLNYKMPDLELTKFLFYPLLLILKILLVYTFFGFIFYSSSGYIFKFIDYPYFEIMQDEKAPVANVLFNLLNLKKQQKVDWEKKLINERIYLTLKRAGLLHEEIQVMDLEDKNEMFIRNSLKEMIIKEEKRKKERKKEPYLREIKFLRKLLLLRIDSYSLKEKRSIEAEIQAYLLSIDITDIQVYLKLLRIVTKDIEEIEDQIFYLLNRDKEIKWKIEGEVRKRVEREEMERHQSEEEARKSEERRREYNSPENVEKRRRQEMEDGYQYGHDWIRSVDSDYHSDYPG